MRFPPMTNTSHRSGGRKGGGGLWERVGVSQETWVQEGGGKKLLSN